MVRNVKNVVEIKRNLCHATPDDQSRGATGSTLPAR